MRRCEPVVLAKWVCTAVPHLPFIAAQVSEALNHLLDAKSTAVRSSSAVTLAKLNPGLFDPTKAAVSSACCFVLLRTGGLLVTSHSVCGRDMHQDKQLATTVCELVQQAGDGSGTRGGDVVGRVQFVAAARGIEALSCLATHTKIKNQLAQDSTTLAALANVASGLEAVVRCRVAHYCEWPSLGCCSLFIAWCGCSASRWC